MLTAQMWVQQKERATEPVLAKRTVESNLSEMTSENMTARDTVRALELVLERASVKVWGLVWLGLRKGCLSGHTSDKAMAPGTESPWGSGWEAKKELVSAGMLASLMGLLWGGETGQ